MASTPPPQNRCAPCFWSLMTFSDYTFKLFPKNFVKELDGGDADLIDTTILDWIHPDDHVLYFASISVLPGSSFVRSLGGKKVKCRFRDFKPANDMEISYSIVTIAVVAISSEFILTFVHTEAANDQKCRIFDDVEQLSLELSEFLAANSKTQDSFRIFQVLDSASLDITLTFPREKFEAATGYKHYESEEGNHLKNIGPLRSFLTKIGNNTVSAILLRYSNEQKKLYKELLTSRPEVCCISTSFRFKHVLRAEDSEASIFVESVLIKYGETCFLCSEECSGIETPDQVDQTQSADGSNVSGDGNEFQDELEDVSDSEVQLAKIPNYYAPKTNGNAAAEDGVMKSDEHFGRPEVSENLMIRERSQDPNNVESIENRKRRRFADNHFNSSSATGEVIQNRESGVPASTDRPMLRPNNYDHMNQQIYRHANSTTNYSDNNAGRHGVATAAIPPSNGRKAMDVRPYEAASGKPDKFYYQQQPGYHESASYGPPRPSYPPVMRGYYDPYRRPPMEYGHHPGYRPDGFGPRPPAQHEEGGAGIIYPVRPSIAHEESYRALDPIYRPPLGSPLISDPSAMTSTPDIAPPRPGPDQYRPRPRPGYDYYGGYEDPYYEQSAYYDQYHQYGTPPTYGRPPPAAGGYYPPGDPYYQPRLPYYPRPYDHRPKLPGTADLPKLLEERRKEQANRQN